MLRDTLWVEDVMWALRVRKTRKEFDKWEVNEHRNEVGYLSCLSAAPRPPPRMRGSAGIRLRPCMTGVTPPPHTRKQINSFEAIIHMQVRVTGGSW